MPSKHASAFWSSFEKVAASRKNMMAKKDKGGLGLLHAAAMKSKPQMKSVGLMDAFRTLVAKAKSRIQPRAFW